MATPKLQLLEDLSSTTSRQMLSVHGGTLDLFIDNEEQFLYSSYPYR
jgi:hypothetical protein